MTLVVDASVVVAALVSDAPVGAWAESALRGQNLVAPELLPFEVANVLRRLGIAGNLSDDVASLAHRDLQLMRIDLVEYESLATRAWELRANLTSYDASYVSLAEALDAPLATLDTRLANAPGPRCTYLLPPQ